MVDTWQHGLQLWAQGSRSALSDGTAVRRRSKFGQAAEDWFKTMARANPVSASELWSGLCQTRPDLTTPSAGRKTPKATCMRDLRADSAFRVHDGHVTYLGTVETAVSHDG